MPRVASTNGVAKRPPPSALIKGNNITPQQRDKMLMALERVVNVGARLRDLEIKRSRQAANRREVGKTLQAAIEYNEALLLKFQTNLATMIRNA